uniref:Uncharacterized protein n=1 Tax=Chromera velia CCMP2878 TaxID=1169474 RepID=A0A0G4I4M2_9ALVE|eukprot:Cvel_1803.t1-p1 / transcript=Cvel_1803.t1 / gene=Cvel_1803 / organism=Chromera_velia_CCMP2878 / gene_product=hypothetical protein / transcript_product=hypothetical protein / location=Cvel_scaffold66:83192-88544(-) / protein_length=1059 / sequence_SO=supercontig / SO=protein_coding / is_pseudo=false
MGVRPRGLPPSRGASHEKVEKLRQELDKKTKEIEELKLKLTEGFGNERGSPSSGSSGYSPVLQKELKMAERQLKKQMDLPKAKNQESAMLRGGGGGTGDEVVDELTKEIEEKDKEIEELKAAKAASGGEGSGSGGEGGDAVLQKKLEVRENQVKKQMDILKQKTEEIENLKKELEVAKGAGGKEGIKGEELVDKSKKKEIQEEAQNDETGSLDMELKSLFVRCQRPEEDNRMLLTAQGARQTVQHFATDDSRVFRGRPCSQGQLPHPSVTERRKDFRDLEREMAGDSDWSPADVERHFNKLLDDFNNMAKQRDDVITLLNEQHTWIKCTIEEKQKADEHGYAEEMPLQERAQEFLENQAARLQDLYGSGLEDHCQALNLHSIVDTLRVSKQRERERDKERERGGTGKTQKCEGHQHCEAEPLLNQLDSGGYPDSAKDRQTLPSSRREKETTRQVASAVSPAGAPTLPPPSPVSPSEAVEPQAVRRVIEGEKETELRRAPTLLPEKGNDRVEATPREPVGGGFVDLKAASTSSLLSKPKPKGPPTKQVPSIRIDGETRGPASAVGSPNNSGPLTPGPSGKLNSSHTMLAKKKPATANGTRRRGKKFGISDFKFSTEAKSAEKANLDESRRPRPALSSIPCLPVPLPPAPSPVPASLGSPQGDRNGAFPSVPTGKRSIGTNSPPPPLSPQLCRPASLTACADTIGEGGTRAKSQIKPPGSPPPLSLSVSPVSFSQKNPNGLLPLQPAREDSNSSKRQGASKRVEGGDVEGLFVLDGTSSRRVRSPNDAPPPSPPADEGGRSEAVTSRLQSATPPSQSSSHRPAPALLQGRLDLVLGTPPRRDPPRSGAPRLITTSRERPSLRPASAPPPYSSSSSAGLPERSAAGGLEGAALRDKDKRPESATPTLLSVLRRPTDAPSVPQHFRQKEKERRGAPTSWEYCFLTLTTQERNKSRRPDGQVSADHGYPATEEANGRFNTVATEERNPLASISPLHDSLHVPVGLAPSLPAQTGTAHPLQPKVDDPTDSQTATAHLNPKARLPSPCAPFSEDHLVQTAKSLQGQ